MPNITETADVLRLALNVGPLPSRVFVDVAGMGGEFFGSFRCLARLVGRPDTDTEDIKNAVWRLECAGLVEIRYINTTGRTRLWLQLKTPGRCCA